MGSFGHRTRRQSRRNRIQHALRRSGARSPPGPECAHSTFGRLPFKHETVQVHQASGERVGARGGTRFKREAGLKPPRAHDTVMEGKLKGQGQTATTYHPSPPPDTQELRVVPVPWGRKLHTCATQATPEVRTSYPDVPQGSSAALNYPNNKEVEWKQENIRKGPPGLVTE
ncbi:hypothetical protein CMV_026965 [Castanea mollissima]|uniref:Uncharacterized protein n=1 Tax=Castanea mollissima TaxID=60419 RepID=A0A8J4QG47_9ROSI|nr:hypothetical protein CMV_026965 [Castanea mollissima]